MMENHRLKNGSTHFKDGVDQSLTGNVNNLAKIGCIPLLILLVLLVFLLFIK